MSTRRTNSWAETKLNLNMSTHTAAPSHGGHAKTATGQLPPLVPKGQERVTAPPAPTSGLPHLPRAGLASAPVRRPQASSRSPRAPYFAPHQPHAPPTSPSPSPSASAPAVATLHANRVERALQHTMQQLAAAQAAVRALAADKAALSTKAAQLQQERDAALKGLSNSTLVLAGDSTPFTPHPPATSPRAPTSACAFSRASSFRSDCSGSSYESDCASASASLNSGGSSPSATPTRSRSSRTCSPRRLGSSDEDAGREVRQLRVQLAESHAQLASSRARCDEALQRAQRAEQEAQEARAQAAAAAARERALQAALARMRCDLVEAVGLADEALEKQEAADKRAAQADKRAAQADERAAQADKRAAQADKRAAQAEARAEEAQAAAMALSAEQEACCLAGHVARQVDAVRAGVLGQRVPLVAAAVHAVRCQAPGVQPIATSSRPDAAQLWVVPDPRLGDTAASASSCSSCAPCTSGRLMLKRWRCSGWRAEATAECEVVMHGALQDTPAGARLARMVCWGVLAATEAEVAEAAAAGRAGDKWLVAVYEYHAGGDMADAMWAHWGPLEEAGARAAEQAQAQAAEQVPAEPALPAGDAMVGLAAEYLVAMARVLLPLHAARILVGDFKGENCVVAHGAARCEAALSVDCESLQLLAPGQEAAPGAGVCTAGLRAPEQELPPDRAFVCLASDVFALGRDAGEWVQRAAGAACSELGANVREALGELVAECTERRPSRRPRVEEVVARAEAALRALRMGC